MSDEAPQTRERNVFKIIPSTVTVTFLLLALRPGLIKSFSLRSLYLYPTNSYTKCTVRIQIETVSTPGILFSLLSPLLV